MTISTGSLIIEKNSAGTFYGIVVSEMVHWFYYDDRLSNKRLTFWKPWKKTLQFYIDEEETRALYRWDQAYEITFLPPLEQYS